MSIRIAEKVLLTELAKAGGSVPIVNGDGDVVGVVTPFDKLPPGRLG